MNKSVLKSIWAVFAGFATVFILSIVTDFILEKLSVFPPASEGLFVPWMLMLALLYRSAYAVLGGYITASASPNKPMRQVWILAFIGLLGALIGLITTWDKNLGPKWYPILLVILTIPCVWLGGKLKAK